MLDGAAHGARLAGGEPPGQLRRDAPQPPLEQRRVLLARRDMGVARGGEALARRRRLRGQPVAGQDHGARERRSLRRRAPGLLLERGDLRLAVAQLPLARDERLRRARVAPQRGGGHPEQLGLRRAVEGGGVEEPPLGLRRRPADLDARVPRRRDRVGCDPPGAGRCLRLRAQVLHMRLRGRRPPRGRELLRGGVSGLPARLPRLELPPGGRRLRLQRRERGRGVALRLRLREEPLGAPRRVRGRRPARLGDDEQVLEPPGGGGDRILRRLHVGGLSGAGHRVAHRAHRGPQGALGLDPAVAQP
jgi:hypothetical protein